jgi:TonB family protein
MPSNIKKFWASILLFFVLVTISFAQDNTMLQRIARARAYVAVKNYNAAVYELEGIRRETKDETVQGVALTMLMNCYLEQGDYRRAQDLLIENFNNQKVSKKPSSIYYSVAGQVVRGARNQAERYRQLGLMLNDQNLPTEAKADLDKMRETLEIIVTQSDQLADANKQPIESFALIEEASNARVTMARDDYDASRWKNKIADTRERMANNNAKVVNVVEDVPKPTPNPNAVAMATPIPTPQPTVIPVSTKKEKKEKVKPTPTPTPYVAKVEPTPTPYVAKVEPTPTPKVENTPVVIKVDSTPKPTPTPFVAKVEPTPVPTPVPTPIETKNNVDPLSSPLVASNNNTVPDTTKTNPTENTNTNSGNSNTSNPTNSTSTPPTDLPTSLDVGSLIGYATETVKPAYPPIAKQMRLAGVVRVNVTVDENGIVSTAESVSGPSMLKRSASDAAKKWKFRPFLRDGQPIKANGFIDFNFAP